MTNDYIAGFVAGQFQTLIGHPLDTIKTNQQFKKQSFFKTSSSILKNNGIKGFLKGLSTPLFVSCVGNGLLFGVNGFFKEQLKSKKYIKDPINLSFAGGALTGALMGFIVTPFDAIKCNVQLKNNKINSFHFLKELYKNNNLCLLGRGFYPTIIREITGFSLYFGSYEYTKSLFKTDSSFSLLFSGAIAGVMAWIINYPIDIIKTRIQTNKNNSMKEAFYDIKNKSTKSNLKIFAPYKNFYVGLGPCLIRAILVNSVLFYVYETIKKL